MFLGEVMPSSCLWVTAGLQLLQIFFFQTAATWVFAALNFRGVNLARAETALYGKYYIASSLKEEKGTFLDLVKTTVVGICKPVLVSACKLRLWKEHILGNRGVELYISVSHCSFYMYTWENSPSVGRLFLRLLIFNTETTCTIPNLTSVLRKYSNPDAWVPNAIVLGCHWCRVRQLD